MSAIRKLNALSKVSSVLSYHHKKFFQTLSSVDNSIVVLLFGYLVYLLGLSEKSTNYMRGLYVYVIMITPQVMTNF